MQSLILQWNFQQKINLNKKAMITIEQVQISKEVQLTAEKYPESISFMIDQLMDDNCQCSPDLQFVNETFKRYKNLVLMLDILDVRYEFITNAILHYRYLINEYRRNLVDDYIAAELAQRDIKELFSHYNSIKIEAEIAI